MALLPAVADRVAQAVMEQGRRITPAFISSIARDMGCTNAQVLEALRSQDAFRLGQAYLVLPEHLRKATQLPQDATELLKRMGVRKNMTPIQRETAFYEFLLDRCAIELGVFPVRFRTFLYTQAKSGKQDDVLRVLDLLLTGKPVREADKATAESIVDFFNHNTCYGRDSSAVDEAGRLIPSTTYIADFKKIDGRYYASKRMQAARRDALAEIQKAIWPDLGVTFTDGKFHSAIKELTQALPE